jgi:hypothetical protein
MSMVNDAEATAPPASELREEAVERAALPALADPDHAGSLVVPADGQVLAVATAIADFVDADDPERAAELAGRRLHDPALDQAHHARPVQAELAPDASDRAVAGAAAHRPPRHA